MKKAICILLLSATVIGFSGCQSAARNLGGDIASRIRTRFKNCRITWKEDSLWYLTNAQERV